MNVSSRLVLVLAVPVLVFSPVVPGWAAGAVISKPPAAVPVTAPLLRRRDAKKCSAL